MRKLIIGFIAAFLFFFLLGSGRKNGRKPLTIEEKWISEERIDTLKPSLIMGQLYNSGMASTEGSSYGDYIGKYHYFNGAGDWLVIPFDILKGDSMDIDSLKGRLKIIGQTDADTLVTAYTADTMSVGVTDNYSGYRLTNWQNIDSIIIPNGANRDTSFTISTGQSYKRGWETYNGWILWTIDASADWRLLYEWYVYYTAHHKRYGYE